MGDNNKYQKIKKLVSILYICMLTLLAVVIFVLNGQVPLVENIAGFLLVSSAVTIIYAIALRLIQAKQIKISGPESLDTGVTNKINPEAIVLLVIPIALILTVVIDMLIKKPDTSPQDQYTFGGMMYAVLVYLSPILLIITLISLIKSKNKSNRIINTISLIIYLIVLGFVASTIIM
jgi:hypothetical protein